MLLVRTRESKRLLNQFRVHSDSVGVNAFFERICNPYKACGRCGPNSLDLTNLGVMNNQIWMQISPDIQAADKEYESMND